MAYRALKGGKIVYGVGGRGMSRGVVARAGQVFEDLEAPDETYFEEVVPNPGHDPDDPDSQEWVTPDQISAQVESQEDADDEPAEHGHEAEDDHEHETTFDGLSAERLSQLVEEHALPVEGTGAQGKVLKPDMIKALKVEHGQA